jgi:hypothetical protein
MTIEFHINLGAKKTEILDLNHDRSAHINVKKHIYADRVVLELEWVPDAPLIFSGLV